MLQEKLSDAETALTQSRKLLGREEEARRKTETENQLLMQAGVAAQLPPAACSVGQTLPCGQPPGRLRTGAPPCWFGSTPFPGKRPVLTLCWRRSGWPAWTSSCAPGARQPPPRLRSLASLSPPLAAWALTSCPTCTRASRSACSPAPPSRCRLRRCGRWLRRPPSSRRLGRGSLPPHTARPAQRKQVSGLQTHDPGTLAPAGSDARCRGVQDAPGWRGASQTAPVTDQMSQTKRGVRAQLASMHPERLAAIWRQYVAHLAESMKLAQTAQETGQGLQQANERVELLASEACVLLMRVSLCNPACSRVRACAGSTRLPGLAQAQ